MRKALLLLVVATLVACTGSGPVQDRPPSPAPTSTVSTAGRVDVGGYELAYECRGTGSPTIVTEAGYDSAGTSTFFGLMDPLAEISRVCAYDRAGTGTSDRRPPAVARGLTVMDQAAELHALLQGADIQPPYVLVGHSFGGFISRLFATAYPEESARLMLIESSHEDEIDAYRRHFTEIGQPGEADWVDGGALLDIDATAEVLRGPGHDLGDLPLIVMRAERYDDVLTEALWRRTQADLATISTDSILVEALRSGHFVIDDDRPAVLEGVAGLVEAARTGGGLPPCDEVFTEADVRCLEG